MLGVGVTPKAAPGIVVFGLNRRRRVDVFGGDDTRRKNSAISYQERRVSQVWFKPLLLLEKQYGFSLERMFLRERVRQAYSNARTYR